MRIRARLAALVALSAWCAWAPAAEKEGAAHALPRFSADRYAAHVRHLASDELTGRRPGTPGIERAAEYIAAHFAAAGLEPAGDDGTWFQTFTVTRGKKLIDAAARLEVSGSAHLWRLHKDWTPLPFTAMEEVTGPLAFAGYGIDSDEFDWNDYADFDADGKILVIFRYEPRADDPDAPFGGQNHSRHALFSRKARVAARHGAKALLIVNPPNRTDQDELYHFSAAASQRTFALPMVHVSQDLAEALLKQAGRDDLQTLNDRLDQERKPLSADLGLDLTLKTGVEPDRITTRNVLGRLPGSGFTPETIIVGAHYDHLGEVPHWRDADPTPVIHNGADDNASGTAGVLEMARVLGQERGLRRDVLFVTFSAEEMGLLGSKHLVEDPPVRLEDLRAMINFDMIGRLHQDKFTVFGVPSSPDFATIVADAAAAQGIRYRAAGGITGNSDHAPFYQHGIPYLFAITGLHKEYHHPNDDWELIDAAGATRVLAMFHQITRTLANLEQGPVFHEQTEPPAPEDELKQPAAEHEPPPAASAGLAQDAPAPGGDDPPPSRPRVSMRVAPDVSGGAGDGLVIDLVVPGGPAQQAGMQAGDRIIRIAGEEIRDVYGYMEVLAGHPPDEVVDVVVVRAGAELTLRVKLIPASARDDGADSPSGQ